MDTVSLVSFIIVGILVGVVIGRCLTLLCIALVSQVSQAMRKAKARKQILKLPTISYQRNGNGKGNALGKEEEEECVVCLDEFCDGDECTVMPSCNHFLHSKCARQWLFHKPTCPVCRSRVLSTRQAQKKSNTEASTASFTQLPHEIP